MKHLFKEPVFSNFLLPRGNIFHIVLFDLFGFLKIAYPHLAKESKHAFGSRSRRLAPESCDAECNVVKSNLSVETWEGCGLAAVDQSMRCAKAREYLTDFSRKKKNK